MHHVAVLWESERRKPRRAGCIELMWEYSLGGGERACGKEIEQESERLEKCERLTVEEWQRERGTTKERKRRCRRSETSKSHPK